ncbi:MAG: hypothetical protein KAR07_09210 [Spirochaetes bacterium]|nr:hypothetical protein [Spirochaetota bacterium]
MDFKAVLSILLSKFEGQDVRYALIGGFALGLLGVGRSTIDLDFLVDKEDAAKVDLIMKDMDYHLNYQSENVSQYISDLKIFGEIDFLHSFRPLSKQMLEQAELLDIFSGELKIRVLKPEDIIGLKFQAVKNDPSRKNRDVDDIKELFYLYKEMDMSLIQKYAEVLDMQGLFKEITSQQRQEDE